MLTTIFFDVYYQVLSGNAKKDILPKIDDPTKFEKVLEEYIENTLGAYVLYHYHRYLESDKKINFEYFGEIRKYFENAIRNIDFANPQPINQSIKEYGENFYKNIKKYPYAKLLFSAIKKTYSNNENEIVIQNYGKHYEIGLLPDKYIEHIPSMVINDISKLNENLKNYIEAIKESDSYYKLVFLQDQCTTEDEAIEQICLWTIRNASVYDMSNLDLFFDKYTSFLKDKSFEQIKNKPTMIGNFLDDDLYISLKTSTIAYETPYYLSFMLAHNRTELPNVRLGIENEGDKRVAHILAVQSSQDLKNPLIDSHLNDIIKQKLPKSNKFRQFNPSHLVSVLISLGIFSGLGINTVKTYDYLPLRYQRFVIEGNKSEEELHDYQYRLTNKYINSFFRLFEFTDDIEICSYPELDYTLMLYLNDKITFNNEFLNYVFSIGYNFGLTLKEKKHLK